MIKLIDNRDFNNFLNMFRIIFRLMRLVTHCSNNVFLHAYQNPIIQLNFIAHLTSVLPCLGKYKKGHSINRYYTVAIGHIFMH